MARDYPWGTTDIYIRTNKTAIQWLKDNGIVVNPSKLQFMFLSKYKNIKKACLLMEKPLHHQSHLNYLDFP